MATPLGITTGANTRSTTTCIRQAWMKKNAEQAQRSRAHLKLKETTNATSKQTVHEKIEASRALRYMILVKTLRAHLVAAAPKLPGNHGHKERGCSKHGAGLERRYQSCQLIVNCCRQGGDCCTNQYRWSANFECLEAFFLNEILIFSWRRRHGEGFIQIPAQRKHAPSDRLTASLK